MFDKAKKQQKNTLPYSCKRAKKLNSITFKPRKKKTQMGLMGCSTNQQTKEDKKGRKRKSVSQEKSRKMAARTTRPLIDASYTRYQTYGHLADIINS